RRQASPQAKPVQRRHVASGNSHKACKARFGGEQVVAVGIESAVGDAVADRKQVTCGIEEKVEFHRVKHFARDGAEGGQSSLECASRVGGARKRVSDRVD